MQFQEKLMNQTSENDKNSSFRHNFSPFGPNSGSQIFFSKIWLDQLLDIKVSYHHVKYQTKLMMQSWENLVTIGPTDGQTDESDFTWHCLANVERPIVNRKIDSQNPKYSFKKNATELFSKVSETLDKYDCWTGQDIGPSGQDFFISQKSQFIFDKLTANYIAR